MSIAARRAAHRVLERHSGLVRTLPVPIVRMAEADTWEIEYEELDVVEGVAIWLPNIRRMLINDQLPPPRRRGVIAHELGHHERDDPTSIQFAPVHLVNPFGTWLHSRAERGAWEVAAHILVPIDLLDDLIHATVDDIARACDVPPGLVVLALGEPW